MIAAIYARTSSDQFVVADEQSPPHARSNTRARDYGYSMRASPNIRETDSRERVKPTLDEFQTVRLSRASSIGFLSVSAPFPQNALGGAFGDRGPQLPKPGLGL